MNELQQSVFSSIHLSTMVKCDKVSLVYPSCPFCKCRKSTSSKTKACLYQISLYTNSSEAFIVWYKRSRPKGMLWTHSCRVARGQDGHIELMSRSCKAHCSYVLKFPTPTQTDDWFQILRKETAQPTDEESERDVGYASLDSILLDAERVRADSCKVEGHNGAAAPKDSIFKSVASFFRSSRKTSLTYPQENDASWDDDASRWSWPLDA